MVKYLQVDVETSPAIRSITDLEEYLSEARLERFFEQRIEGYMSERVHRRFQSEGDDASGPWAPLSRATLKVKGSEGKLSYGINVRSGQMLQWATDGTFGVSREASGPAFTYPKRKPTGKLREKVEGAQYGEGKAPPRPVIALGERDAVEILERFASYFDEVLR